jgi:hypothetical protein
MVGEYLGNATLEDLLQDLEHLRFTSKDMAVYRLPVAYLLAGKAEQAVAYVRKELEVLGDRKDLAAQEYRTFASNLLAASQGSGMIVSS